MKPCIIPALFIAIALLSSSCDMILIQKERNRGYAKDRAVASLGTVTEKAKTFKNLKGDYKKSEYKAIYEAIKDSHIENGELSRKLLKKLAENGDYNIIITYGDEKLISKSSGAYRDNTKNESSDNEIKNKENVKEEYVFRRVDDVFNYLNKHTFMSNDGVRVTIRPEGVYAKDGDRGQERQIGGAVKVSLNNQYSATVTSNSPYGGRLTLIVNCNLGKILDSTGISFYEQ